MKAYIYKANRRASKRFNKAKNRVFRGYRDIVGPYLKFDRRRNSEIAR